MKSKDLQTTQRNRLLILVSLLAVAGLCRFSPPAIATRRSLHQFLGLTRFPYR